MFNNPNLKSRNYHGKAGEYRVLSELLLRDIWASPLVVEGGADLVLNDGRLIQVRSRKMSSDGSIRCVFFNRQGKYNFDYMIIWGSNTDLFYIIPVKVIKNWGRTSVYLNTTKGTPKEFHKYLNAWEIFK